tara:strand:- start:275 stop:511 length:237 start_codon:yes stop_codon:yes gene_type:complete
MSAHDTVFQNGCSGFMPPDTVPVAPARMLFMFMLFMLAHWLHQAAQALSPTPTGPLLFHSHRQPCGIQLSYMGVDFMA